MTTSDRRGLDREGATDMDAPSDQERPVPESAISDLPPVEVESDTVESDTVESDPGTADTDLSARLTVDPERDDVKG